jgi:hypothetical protein
MRWTSNQIWLGAVTIVCLIAMLVVALREQPHARGIAAGEHAVAVVLDLVNPLMTGRRLVGTGWEAGLDEARHWTQTQHSGQFVARELRPFH